MTEQTNARYCVLVNGHAVEPGCWVDGHHGQYGPDHLADRAEELGWSPGDIFDDPRRVRWLIEQIESWGYPRNPSDMGSEGVGIIATLWEIHGDNTIEQWLNTETAPMCPHCGDPMYATSDGFYRHLNFPALVDDGPCEYRAIDEPIFYSWGWHDGEFYLWPQSTWEESE